MERQNMVDVHETYYETAKSVIAEFDDPIEEMVGLQLKLMLDIVSKRNLEKMPVIEIMKNTVLAMFDEINEANDWYREFKIAHTKEVVLNMRYELIDLYHFMLQFLILAYMQEKKWTFLDVLQEPEYRESITKAVTCSIKQYLKEHRHLHLYLIEELITNLFAETSALLNMLPWKHWKTYTHQPNYYIVEQSMSNMHSVVLWFSKRLGIVDFNDFIAHYIAKNFENVDRQVRGY